MVDGPNVYGYVTGNPVMLVDPVGGSAIVVFALLGAAAAMSILLWLFGAQAFRVLKCINEAYKYGMANSGGGNYNFQGHCAMGCKFAQCMKAKGAKPSLILNILYELLGGMLEPDVSQDNLAAYIGGVIGVGGAKDCAAACIQTQTFLNDCGLLQTN